VNKHQSFKLIGVATIVALFSIAAIGAKEDAGKEVLSKQNTRKALPVARIGDTVITLGYLESIINRQSPMLRKDLSELEKKKEFLDKIIKMELLANEAKRRGFTDHSKVSSVKKNQLANLMHKKIANAIAEIEPNEPAMRKYYDDHIDSYDKPEKFRARHILIKDKAKAEELLAQIKKDKPSQYNFRKLAQEKSEDEATKMRGGDLTFFSKPEERRKGDPKIAPAIVKAVFSINKNGDIYNSLIKTDDGYHILMRTGYRKKMKLSFEDARDRIALLVKRETRKNKTEAAIDALTQKYKVTLHEENLKDVVIDLSGGPPKHGLNKLNRIPKPSK